eukprot:1196363-Prorocentrum_minimum.AAC.2
MMLTVLGVQHLCMVGRAAAPRATGRQRTTGGVCRRTRGGSQGDHRGRVRIQLHTQWFITSFVVGHALVVLLYSATAITPGTFIGIQFAQQRGPAPIESHTCVPLFRGKPRTPTICPALHVCSEMTKDLAILVHGWGVAPDQYLNTVPFIDAVAARLKDKLVQGL